MERKGGVPWSTTRVARPTTLPAKGVGIKRWSVAAVTEELKTELRESEKVAGNSSSRAREYSRAGWTFRTRKAPILNTAGHYA